MTSQSLTGGPTGGSTSNSLDMRRSGLFSDKDDVRQVSTLLYCLGEGAEDVLTSMGITSQERAKYDKVLEKFDNFF